MAVRPTQKLGLSATGGLSARAGETRGQAPATDTGRQAARATRQFRYVSADLSGIGGRHVRSCRRCRAGPQGTPSPGPRRKNHGRDWASPSLPKPRAARPAPASSAWWAKGISSSTSSTARGAWAATGGTRCGPSRPNCSGASKTSTPSINSRSSSTTNSPPLQSQRHARPPGLRHRRRTSSGPSGSSSRSRPRAARTTKRPSGLAIRLRPT